MSSNLCDKLQAEWGYVFAGSILISAVDENGKFQLSKLEVGDVWYFPKGEAHTIQGLDDQNEYLLVFDDGNFDPTGYVFSARCDLCLNRS
jgi:oxalate decarboxylase